MVECCEFWLRPLSQDLFSARVKAMSLAPAQGKTLYMVEYLLHYGPMFASEALHYAPSYSIGLRIFQANTATGSESAEPKKKNSFYRAST